MASASDHRAHAALQPADCLILLPQRLPAAVETSIGPAHYPAECTQSDAFLQPSLRARKGRANSNSFPDNTETPEPRKRESCRTRNRKYNSCKPHTPLSVRLHLGRNLTPAWGTTPR